MARQQRGIDSSTCKESVMPVMRANWQHGEKAEPMLVDACVILKKKLRISSIMHGLTTTNILRSLAVYCGREMQELMAGLSV